MRISTNEDDSGYQNYLHHKGELIYVYLDGERLEQVLTADEEEGMVEVAARNEESHLYCDGDRIATRNLHGVVTVDIAPDFESWMRNRTERAHAAYMARHAGGGKAY